MTPGSDQSQPHRRTLLAGAVLGLSGVALGAWAAHGLDGELVKIYGDRLTDARGFEEPAVRKYLADFGTGVRYQMMHAITLVAIASLPSASRLRSAAAVLMTLGTLIFSGSLYALVLTDTPKLGAITPIGGVLLLAGWSCLVALSLRRSPAAPSPGDASPRSG